MRIGVVGSMHHAEKMLWACEELKKMGHTIAVSSNAPEFLGKTEAERVEFQKHCQHERSAIRDFWSKMDKIDAIVVMNFERKGIPNYIGGNTLMEIGFAHVLNLKIFLFNPIPDIPFYKAEIEAINPVILNGDLTKII
jgi:hypothetical protein